MMLFISCVCVQAWWVTDKLSTDLWGKWELNDLTWHYTNQQGYAEGETPFMF